MFGKKVSPRENHDLTAILNPNDTSPQHHRGVSVVRWALKTGNRCRLLGCGRVQPLKLIPYDGTALILILLSCIAKDLKPEAGFVPHA